MIDAFIISPGRTASSSIYYSLNEIGDLQLPLNKEPHYFIDLKGKKKKNKILNNLNINNYQDYKKIYKKSCYKIDASTGYFYYVDEFIKNLKKKKINPKIIFLIREPISRSKSLYIHQIKNENENELSFEKCLKRKVKKNVWWQNYYNNTEYHNVYLKLKKNFPKILVIEFEIFNKNQNREINKIFKFLNIKKKKNIKILKLNTSNLTILEKLKQLEFKRLVYLIMQIFRFNYPWKRTFYNTIKTNINKKYYRYDINQYAKLKKELSK